AVPILVLAFFVVNLFVHGLVIWTDPLQRLAALAAGAIALVCLVLVARQGAFARRVVVELRQDERAGGRTTLSVVEGGRPGEANMVADGPDGRQARRASAIDAG